jgi:adenosyl cobinamide kinase/adenosyl cobinamide phosphate guanylyltransferase
MKVACEQYKGITYIRIAALPEKQKQQFWVSFDQEKIIKILKDDTLLNDCVLFNDYTEWLKSVLKEEVSMPVTESISVVRQVA